jgi:hypothetical protein
MILHPPKPTKHDRSAFIDAEHDEEGLQQRSAGGYSTLVSISADPTPTATNKLLEHVTTTL